MNDQEISVDIEIIPDEALVARGGRNRPEDIQRGTGIHPSGVTGVSVECATGLTVAKLATAIPHGQIGVTTVGEVRQAGGDVIRTSGRGPNHATLTGLTPEQASSLLTPTIPNPARQD
ncbi:MAG: flavoredoxin [Blastocatellia bacterium]